MGKIIIRRTDPKAAKDLQDILNGKKTVGEIQAERGGSKDELKYLKKARWEAWENDFFGKVAHIGTWLVFILGSIYVVGAIIFLVYLSFFYR